jgi:hypothetical protein
MYFETNEPDKTVGKKDLEDNLLKEKLIIRERLLVPNEEIPRDMIMGNDVLRNYKDGFPIFLHILVRYKFLGADDERQGAYMGVFRLERSDGGYNPDIEREWAE